MLNQSQMKVPLAPIVSAVVLKLNQACAELFHHLPPARVFHVTNFMISIFPMTKIMICNMFKMLPKIGNIYPRHSDAEFCLLFQEQLLFQLQSPNCLF